MLIKILILLACPEQVFFSNIQTLPAGPQQTTNNEQLNWVPNSINLLPRNHAEHANSFENQNFYCPTVRCVVTLKVWDYFNWF